MSATLPSQLLAPFNGERFSSFAAEGFFFFRNSAPFGFLQELFFFFRSEAFRFFWWGVFLPLIVGGTSSVFPCVLVQDYSLDASIVRIWIL